MRHVQYLHSFVASLNHLSCTFNLWLTIKSSAGINIDLFMYILNTNVLHVFCRRFQLYRLKFKERSAKQKDTEIDT